MALVEDLDHFNISTSRLDETVAFFEEILGLENRPDDRPDFGFPGAWLFAGSRALVHLVEQEVGTGEPSGPLDHVAFATSDFDGLVARLIEREIDHQLSGQPAIGLRQVFFREPNGVRIEVTSRS
jgi:catechol 2,3-dioxygenase-like lactoylglutathione lyase family enzyme